MIATTVEEQKARKAAYNRRYREKHKAELLEKRRIEREQRKEKRQQERIQALAAPYTEMPKFACVLAEYQSDTIHAIVEYRPFEAQTEAYIARILKNGNLKQEFFASRSDAVAFLRKHRLKKIRIYADISMLFITEHEERSD